ncbi:plasmid segregation oscillating ATPase ParF [Ferrimonas balearica DSM 9799]|uniref:Plasmid segregation oscillating ATPase ParF n=1 Tax=Ferrimonas balearica (strain DSM 9799 / CCM 4581 / KCTC 23876 / PAT) TaxID=550540 RepID=E1SNL1_FERBD|nr:AAA family ATPase [Ferrimonas balearica]MBY6018498.1 AAA family ATPase [Halomonas denitrificans]ADN76684.1 plasmid segregation oscillating ATPase ParF [Ferrimonas balearica DSM 9799]MBW3140329.1 AAA family ATPase [Ferrimonas balearica]MBW3166344.1 AAA family ATPase [Ferrimonas balearica]MBY5979787.1 AAA family ATPase [Ferrimonas balearica]
MIILVGGEKGGSGKSCLAQNIAVYLRTEEEGNVLMVDCDPQRTTSDWVQERNSNPQLPHINCIQLYGKIRNELLSLRERYDYLVIDCGGQDNLALRSSMAVADHVLVPLRPKRRDLKTVEHMEDIVSTCKMVNPRMNMAFVITQCPSLPSLAPRILEAKEVCRSYDMTVLDAVTYSRNMYDDSEESGMSVMESEPDGKCAAEIRTIIHELLCRGQGADHESTQLETHVAVGQ